jgi:hypothetical protein
MGSARQCRECGSPLADDQRYCLTCGARDGERGAQLESLLAAVAEQPPSEPGPAAQPSVPAAQPVRAASLLRLPSPLVSALLVAAFVGFGALLGSAASSPARLTASSAPLHVELPNANAAGGPASTSASEPPATQPESTPEPESSEEAKTSTTKTTANSKGSEKEASEETEKKGTSGSKPAAAPKLTQIKHVFLIVLSDEPYAGDFGPESSDHYLSGTLEKKGELLLRYDAVAHEQLPNEIALLSGQGPTPQTAANCPTFAAVSPGSSGSDEQITGEGCLYPSSVQTLPGQLTAKHLTWRAYVQGIDEPGTPAGACAHPEPGAAGNAVAGSYATYRDPFVYFQSLLSSPLCPTDVVGASALKSDLAGSGSHAPSFAYIAPDLCHDGNPTPCAPGAKAQAGDAAGFLEEVVGEITKSKAYKQDGLIVITSDEAPSSGEYADSSSCCGQPASYPDYKAPGRGQGGGVVGALLLSPLIKGATTSQEPYDHYSLLRTIEDIFGLSHIGYAALPEVKSFSTALLNVSAAG